MGFRISPPPLPLISAPRARPEEPRLRKPGFAAAYLVLHGGVKIILVIALWANKLWAYPLAIFAFTAFVFYQVLRFTHTHSLGLFLLTIGDIAIIWLTWMEYLEQKRLTRRNKN